MKRWPGAACRPSDRDPLNEFTLAVVGLDHPNTDRTRSNRRYEALLCAPGDPVTLRPDPANPVDPQAVAVWSERGIQIGYLTAERAPMIGARLRAGQEAAAIFQGMSARAAFIRVRLGGGAPTLPDARAATDAAGSREDEFTDPDGPDWGA